MRRARRAHGVPAIRGELKITRPDGTVEFVSATAADRHARKVVRNTQGRGRAGRSM